MNATCAALAALALGLATASSLMLQSSLAKEACEHDATTFRCVKYLRNYDADTVTVEIPGVHPLLGEAISIRVAGIDTPEIKTRDACEKSAGRTAQRLIESMLKNAKRVDLENVERDKYFRILADVRVDGRLLSDLLLKHSLAYPYEGGTKQKIDWCKIRLPAGTSTAGGALNQK